MKKKHEEEHENLERWLVSYADFITLLFAFFTVMYALSLTDKKHYKDAIENIQRAFQSAGGVHPLRGAPMVPFEKLPNEGSETPPSPADKGKMSKSDDGESEKVAEQIRELFEKTTGLTPGVGEIEILKTNDGYKIRLGENMIFKSGSDKLRRETVPFLYELGKRLAGLSFPIQVEGHADALEAHRAKNSSPWQISLSRSNTVAQFLVEGVGFPQKMISLAGFGDTQPLAENTTPDGRMRNRRVEIGIIAPDRDIAKLNW
jgi:chemotaxis protein MotB